MIHKKYLKHVQKPGRYLGTEINAIRKKHARGMVSFCLGFPDLYEIGMSHMGMHILYGIVNQLPHAVCERVFAPALDYEALVRKKKIPLASLESNTPLKKFDIVGFSLQYELGYTNLLTMLDCAGIPLKSCDRQDGPLIIAGGPSCANPEILAEVIDIFVIGDGEERIIDIVRIVEAHKKLYKRIVRKILFQELRTIEGLYIPSLYTVSYLEDGRVQSISPIGSAPFPIRKTYIKDYESAFFPQKPIVPYIHIVHDRACVEIMRGCPNTCKFCQARSYYYPVRRRSPETVKKLAEAIIHATGHEELSLLSLSSGDYPGIDSLLGDLQKCYEKERIALSLPSIRVEKLVAMLPQYLSLMKKSGLTFAPEAGSDRLRQHIGKNISIQYLFDAARAAFENGYQHIKLYFMIGLPTETYEDLDAMVQLIFDVAHVRKAEGGRPGQINATIGTFIPKPHTAFEREGMNAPLALKEKQAYLRERLRKRYIKCNFTNIEVSMLEAALSRGDRRIGRVIMRAWEKGARFDGWMEHFKYALWKEAFQEEGIDLEQYATRSFTEHEVLPWSLVRMQ